MKNGKINDDGNTVKWLKVQSFRHASQINAVCYKYDFDDRYLKIVVCGPWPNFEPKCAYKDRAKKMMS